MTAKGFLGSALFGKHSSHVGGPGWWAWNPAAEVGSFQFWKEQGARLDLTQTHGYFSSLWVRPPTRAGPIRK